MNKKVIYTAIFGDYDTLKEPTIITEGWDYVCFTNQDITSETWNVIKIDTKLPNHIICRELWIYPYDYLDYDVAISIGGQIHIKCDLNDYFLKHKENQLTILSHPDRQCVYQELMTIALLKKDNWNSVIKQAEYLHSIKMPQNNGVYATGLMIRDLSDIDTKNFCDKWLTEFNNSHCFRDQVSLSLALWKYNFTNLNMLDFNDIKNSYFELKKHK